MFEDGHLDVRGVDRPIDVLTGCDPSTVFMYYVRVPTPELQKKM